jgi:hypothetical protein
MDKALIQAKIDKARQRLTRAEEELEIAMRALQGGPRAEKVKVSDLIKDAFDELRAARADLAGLDELVSEGTE